MLVPFFNHLELYWIAWINLFPSIPLWAPHGAAMTLIVGCAAAVLAGKYLWNLSQRA
ncbi:MAG: hypothetical protein QF578_04020 [Alphaproteobacteria bacterium]|jgi:hypothetical protein|nr:hypothetical protein [Alphaproteobacteria bacterium]MDP6563968.1 hypothetical protein [Alphaproteobacteria bacterium]|tara:strand:+ start:84 stop:254 length:171 start_codon:yes stop_codon:yes gene_type:complete